MKTLAKFLIVFLGITLICGPLSAEQKQKKGKLDSFEEEIDQPKGEDDQVTPEAVATESISSVMSNFFLSGLAGTAGGYTSLSEMQKQLRETESPALPLIRVEPSYQYVFDGVHGFAGQVEMGYLMFGLDAEYLYYWEKENNDNLNFVGGHFLLRTLFAQIIEADMALGARAVVGNDSHTGFDIGFPFYVFFGKHFIWDVRPFFTIMPGNNIYDLSSGVSYKYKMFGVRAAYRMINTGGETLHGPRIGAFFQW
jgi:hypothetical protein